MLISIFTIVTVAFFALDIMGFAFNAYLKILIAQPATPFQYA